MARVIDRVASDRPLPGGDAVVMPMPRRPTQMARTCIIARSRAALLRPACAIERAAVGAVDDGDRAARIAIAIIGIANEIRLGRARPIIIGAIAVVDRLDIGGIRSEEHTSELQALIRISYAVVCLQKK